MQKTGDNCIWFTYDENGLVTGFRYNGQEYYYYKNLQGDIIGIVDSTGTEVARYSYSAWGFITYISDGEGMFVDDPNHIANINPFRYRGYYYDNESGLYYLNSRYYDPFVCRFLNADGYVSTGQGVTSNNMFAYCGNDPVNRSDPSGEWWWVVAAVVAVVIVVKNEWYAKKNYKHNSQVDKFALTTTKNTIINDQQKDTGKNFEYGNYPASHNSCEAIAIHNAKVEKGIESTLSETIRDCQTAGAMPIEGYFGTNPFEIGTDLDRSGLSYSRVGINEMDKKGVYIMSYWNEWAPFNGLHTVAIKYDGSQYAAYNLLGDGQVYPITPSDYSFKFICGYYLGDYK